MKCNRNKVASIVISAFLVSCVINTAYDVSCATFDAAECWTGGDGHSIGTSDTAHPFRLGRVQAHEDRQPEVLPDDRSTYGDMLQEKSRIFSNTVVGGVLDGFVARASDAGEHDGREHDGRLPPGLVVEGVLNGFAASVSDAGEHDGREHDGRLPPGLSQAIHGTLKTIAVSGPPTMRDKTSWNVPVYMPSGRCILTFTTGTAQPDDEVWYLQDIGCP